MMFPTYSETFLFSLVLSFVFLFVCLYTFYLLFYVFLQKVTSRVYLDILWSSLSSILFIAALYALFFARNISFYRNTNYMFLTRHRRAILHYLAMQSF